MPRDKHIYAIQIEKIKTAKCAVSFSLFMKAKMFIKSVSNIATYIACNDQNGIFLKKEIIKNVTFEFYNGFFG